MTGIPGQFYDGHSSVRHPVELEIAADGRLRLTGLGEVREYRLSETEVSERIGHTPRTLRFADGARKPRTSGGLPAARWIASRHGART